MSLLDRTLGLSMEPGQEAERLLKSVWAEINEGETVIPIDPIRISHELGIDVLVAELAPDVSGIIVKKSGHDPRILLNRDDNTNRIRFTCAHELGHFVQHAEDPDKYEYVDLRGPLSKTGMSAKERFANAFAAALLMPEEEVKRRVGEGATITELAWAFRVSPEAMVYRLQNLNLPSREL